MTAARVGNLKLVRLLITYGADVNTVGFGANTASHFAKENVHIDVVNELVGIGAKEQDETSERQLSPCLLKEEYEVEEQSFGVAPFVVSF
jgi:ankyrin repeat protein